SVVLLVIVVFSAPLRDKKAATFMPRPGVSGQRLGEPAKLRQGKRLCTTAFRGKHDAEKLVVPVREIKTHPRSRKRSALTVMRRGPSVQSSAARTCFLG